MSPAIPGIATHLPPQLSMFIHIDIVIVGNIRVATDVPDCPVTGVIKIREQETMLQLLSEVVRATPVRQSSQVTML